MKTLGQAVIFGSEEKWLKAPITNIPSDASRVRLRFRNDKVATAFVKRNDGTISRFVLQPDGPFSSGKIKLGWVIATNKTT